MQTNTITEGITIKGDYTEGIVVRVEDAYIRVEWNDGGEDAYTMDQVEEYGFTFYN